MIIFYRTTDTHNMIHVVTGMETDVSVGLNGNVGVDITPIINSFSSDKPVMLSYSRVGSEVELLSKMNTTGMAPPFMAPLAVINDKEVVGLIMPGRKQSDEKDEPAKEPVKSEGKIVDKSKHVKLNEGVCSQCLGKGQLIRVGNSPAICTSCFKINTALKLKAKAKKKDIKSTKDTNLKL